MTVDIYTDNVLGGERELLESCQFGDYDIVLATNATVAAFCNDIYCLDIPWILKTNSRYTKCWTANWATIWAIETQRSWLPAAAVAGKLFPYTVHHR